MIELSPQLSPATPNTQPPSPALRPSASQGIGFPVCRWTDRNRTHEFYFERCGLRRSEPATTYGSATSGLSPVAFCFSAAGTALSSTHGTGSTPARARGSPTKAVVAGTRQMCRAIAARLEQLVALRLEVGDIDAAAPLLAPAARTMRSAAAGSLTAEEVGLVLFVVKHFLL